MSNEPPAAVGFGMSLVASVPYQLCRTAQFGPWLRRERCRSASAREAGFTLVEVIVALAILSASLSVLLGMISGGLLRTSGAERMIEAGSLTQSLLAEIGTDYPVMAGEHLGEFADGYHWHLEIQPIGGRRQEGTIGLYQVSAEVEWEEGIERRSFRLNTLRVGPKAAQR